MNEAIASHQFAEDYILVIENDFNSYKEIMDSPECISGNMSALSDRLRAEFETYIGQVVEREKENGYETGGDLIAQMLIGWGTTGFDRIARHFLELKTESEA